MKRAADHQSARGAGYSYVEVLIAMALIAGALVPATNALRTAVTGASAHEVRLTGHYALTGRLEQVLAESYTTLRTEADAVGDETTPTSYSDPPATPDRLLVYLSAYDMDDADNDGNPFTGEDPDVVWVRMTMENTNHALETLVVP